MATRSAAELLIRIAADPSKAEAGIRQFRASLQTWKSEIGADFGEILNTSQALQSGLVGTFEAFDLRLSANTANAIIWQKSIGAAFGKAAVQAIGALAQESLVRAIYSTALGFYLLAIRDFEGAANAFEAAATFGLVGGAAALAGRALAGSLSGPGSPSTNSTRSAGSTSAAQPRSTASAAPAAQQTVQVIFQGPVYGGQAGIDELVRQISTAVTQRDVNLVAYTVVRQPATRA